MANYAKCQILCNLLFAMFAILFISSRLGVYPVWYVPLLSLSPVCIIMVWPRADSIDWLSISSVGVWGFWGVCGGVWEIGRAHV